MIFVCGNKTILVNGKNNCSSQINHMGLGARQSVFQASTKVKVKPDFSATETS